MRYILTALAVIIVLLPTVAQVPLSHSIRHSAYTYVFKLTKKEMTTLVKSNLSKVDERYLHSRADSFRTDGKVPMLSPGNYLFVHAQENKLVYTLHTPANLQVKVLNNNNDISILLHDRQGTMVTNATIYYGKKRLSYNQQFKNFGPVKKSRYARLTVDHNDILYSFPLEVSKIQKPRLSKITRSLHPKYIASRIRRKIRNLFDADQSFYRATTYERRFSGFMVFNKPEYKPGDTVHLKAFVQKQNGSKVNRNLLVRLSGGYFDVDTILATIKPYRPGGYEYQFILSDSLDIDLDEDYLITLEEESSRKFDISKYEGDLDEEVYAAKRKVISRGRFRFEEYELESINFSARSSAKYHMRGEEAAIFLKAVDENDLPVMDGRVELLVKPEEYGPTRFHGVKVFLPDTLWHHTMPLEQVGETRLVLPDSIFPKASFPYRIECRFLNSNNELQTETLFMTFNDAKENILFEAGDDSLKIDYQLSGKKMTKPAMLFVLQKQDTLERRKILLPAVLKLHPFATDYIVDTEDRQQKFTLKNNELNISANASRTADSVTVQLVNPYQYPVWYTIFAGKTVIHRGYGTSFLYQEKVRTAKNYFVSLEYISNNQVEKETFTVPFQNKLLSVQVAQPAFIYPGQKTAINIQVSDSKGKPVENADLTAYAYTTKFQAPEPYVPYLGKLYPLQRRKYGSKLTEDEEQELRVILNWKRRSRELNLDTNAYYQFMHPGSVYTKWEAAKDSITQIAPFVVHNGAIEPVYLLYIDEVPVFFSQADQLQRYSFKVYPGRSSIRLRTKDKMIKLDSIHVRKGMKTFISIEADTSNKRIHIDKMPDTLTNYEKELWAKYMILVQNNFREKITYIQDFDKFYLLNENIIQSKAALKVGPINSLSATFISKNGFEQDFQPEGNWLFTISKGLIKQKQYNWPYPFSSTLTSNLPTYPFADFVLTKKEIDSLWQHYLDNRSRHTDLFKYPNAYTQGRGRLRISETKNMRGELLFIRNIILFRNDNPDFMKVYRGVEKDLGTLEPGNYRLFFLLKKDQYFIKDSIVVRSNGINYYETGPYSIQEKDSSSTKISTIIEARDAQSWTWQGDDAKVIKETFNDRFLDLTDFSEGIRGIVTDDAGSPLAGVSLFIKGTHIGTSTDEQGRFVLRAPRRAILTVHFIGYDSQELAVEGRKSFNIVLKAATSNLSEVVVTGYSTQSKRAMVGSVSVVSESLSGKAAGIILRGATTSSAPSPLVIVDGIPYAMGVDDIDKSMIASMNVLKGDAATAIYGAQAAGGAIVITTIKKRNVADSIASPDQEIGNSLRRNFHDHAYWQPKLKTDANGNASFQVQFPDDITNWKAFVIAMGNDKQSGFSVSSIRSFKALSGNIALPQFAVTGDSMNVIGKTLNYLSDTIQVRRTFSLNDELLKDNIITLKNALIDTFSVTAADRDSLKLKYTITKNDGYFDGEERSIPVFKPGVLETNGFFAALNADTTFRITMKPDSGVIKLYAEASVLPALYEESERIRNYEYLCNEQLASKLKGLLVERKIDAHLKRPFRHEKMIREIVTKLNKSKSTSGLWGWWQGNDESLWISLHVLEALMDADVAGYKTTLNKPILVDYLVYKMEKLWDEEKISALFLLHKLGAKADFKTYVDSVEKRNKRADLYQHLRLVEFKQLVGLPVIIDTFINKQKSTLFGNVFWGDDNYMFFNNSIQNTLGMYRILKSAGGNELILKKIRNYFLEKRKTGYWRNTYESSLILETILPDLLAEDSTRQPAAISINKQDTIKQFPFYREIKDAGNITITKSGIMPVYFTASQQYWSKTPESTSGNFAVTSFFLSNKDTVSMLKAGVPVLLKVKVRVKAEADYVLIEIPIPAGCSYRDKLQPTMYNEVHREYFKNKVSIFCRSLNAGDYQFTVSLLPRFNGRYILNPAKAEMMYFPVFNGREALKKVSIN